MGDSKMNRDSEDIYQEHLDAAESWLHALRDLSRDDTARQEYVSRAQAHAAIALAVATRMFKGC